MKRIISSIISVCMVLTMAISFTACGNSKEFANVSEFMKSAEIQKTIEDSKNNVSKGGNFVLDIYADGDSKFVYEYKCNEQVEFTDDKVEQMDNLLEENKQEFLNLIDEMEKSIKAKDLSCVIKYTNADGSEILTKEFKK